jgi:hypothetical protein
MSGEVIDLEGVQICEGRDLNPHALKGTGI